jgi:hypothetical protein
MLVSRGLRDAVPIRVNCPREVILCHCGSSGQSRFAGIGRRSTSASALPGQESRSNANCRFASAARVLGSLFQSALQTAAG